MENELPAFAVSGVIFSFSLFGSRPNSSKSRSRSARSGPGREAAKRSWLIQPVMYLNRYKVARRSLFHPSAKNLQDKACNQKYKPFLGALGLN